MLFRSLADYASDKSTPTPTAAAEYVTPNADDVVNSINVFVSKFFDQCITKIKDCNNQADNILLSIKQFNPKQIIKNHIEERNRLEKILRITLKAKIDEICSQLEVSRTRLSSSSRNLNQTIKLFKKSILDSKKNIIEKRKSLLIRKEVDITNMIKMISSYNPSLNLKRGFSIIRSKDSKIIKSTTSFKRKSIDSIQLSDGTITVKNIEIE